MIATSLPTYEVAISSFLEKNGIAFEDALRGSLLVGPLAGATGHGKVVSSGNGSRKSDMRVADRGSLRRRTIRGGFSIKQAAHAVAGALADRLRKWDRAGATTEANRFT